MFKTKFTEADAKRLAALAIPKLEQSVGVVHTTLNGENLITEKEVYKRVRHLLETSESNTDRQEVALKLDVSTKVIDAVLDKAVADTHSYADTVLILPVRRIEKLLASLEESEPRNVGDVCSDERVTVKALQSLFSRNSKLSIINDDVVSDSLVLSHLENMRQAMAKAETPMAYSDVEPNYKMLAVVKQRLGIPVHENTYVPQSYLLSKNEEASKQLAKDGVIETKLLEFDSASRFARTNNATVVGAHIVSTEYIQQLAQCIYDTVNADGYWDTKNIDALNITSFPFVTDTDIFSSCVPLALEDTKVRRLNTKYANVLIKPTFEGELETQILEELDQTIDEIAEKCLENTKIDGSVNIQSIVDNAQLPSVRDISTYSDVPQSLIAGISNRVRQKLRGKLFDVLESKVSNILKQIECKCRSYLNGLETLKTNPSLHTAAWEEWLQYVNEHGFHCPVSEDEAFKQFAEESSGATLEIANVAKQQLQKTNNPAKVLYLAALIYHSKLIEKEGISGFLKLSSKHLPKLLSAFPFPEEFKQLRKQLKNASPEVINSVKSVCIQ